MNCVNKQNLCQIKYLMKKRLKRRISCMKQNLQKMRYKINLSTQEPDTPSKHFIEHKLENIDILIQNEE